MNKEFKFNTLLNDNSLTYDERWRPTQISTLTSLLNKGLLEDLDSNIRSNISYNIQYLEFIDFELKELRLHSVITKMLYKNFIITSISIVEAIFYYILKSNHQVSTNNKELLYNTSSNKKYLNDDLIIETKVYKKVEPIEIEMKFETMIQKMEKKSYLDLNHEYFPYLKHFKDLRNRVHIHITEGNNKGTDYMMFDKADYLFSKYILLSLLIDDNILKLERDPFYNEKLVPHAYDFLVLSKEERKIIKDKYKIQKN